MTKYYLFLFLLITTCLLPTLYPLHADEPGTLNELILPKNTIVIETESAVQKDRGVEIVKQDGASGGAAIICPPLCKAYYDVDLPETGVWYLWVRLFCPNLDADSCWVGMDDTEAYPAENAKGDIGIRIFADSGDSVNNSTAHQVWYWDAGMGNKDPRSNFTVSKTGRCHLWVKGRETGTVIDTVLLTMDKDFNPEILLKGGAIRTIKNQPSIAPTPYETKSNEEIFLWSGLTPGAAPLNIHDNVINKSIDPNAPDRVISSVTRPSITLFAPIKSNGAAVLIIPGGSNGTQNFDREGTEIAKWLNTIGITGFVLKYHQSVQDPQRALRLIRKNAAQWGLNPAKIGVMGFSSGGDPASTLGTGFNYMAYKPTDEADTESARPSFMVLIYPNIPTAGLQVTKETPPTFIVIGDNDIYVSVDDSVRFYTALRKAKVPAEMHIFVHGSHGFAIRGTGPVAGWPNLCKDWMKEIGLFK